MQGSVCSAGERGNGKLCFVTQAMKARGITFSKIGSFFK